MRRRLLIDFFRARRYASAVAYQLSPGVSLSVCVVSKFIRTVERIELSFVVETFLGSSYTAVSVL